MNGIDDFVPELTKREEKYLNKIQPLIEYCSYCQPYDGGEVIWVLGDRIELDELFYKYNIPDDIWENLLPHLHCNSCGSSSFDLGSDIGLKTQYEKDIEKQYDKAAKTYANDVKGLIKFLQSYPLLAYQNQFARKIYREISLKKLPTTTLKRGENLFRAKIVKSSEIPEPEEMFCAPKGISNEGRFNHAGQSHLYLAWDKETALLEVADPQKSSLVWVQEYKIKKEITDILDLSFTHFESILSKSILLLSLNLSGTLQKSDRNNGLWKPDYFITRYIMDCAKSIGYNGIKYNSSKNTTEFNVVLFYTNKIKIEEIGKPDIEKHLISKKNESKSSFDLDEFTEQGDLFEN